MKKFLLASAILMFCCSGAYAQRWSDPGQRWDVSLSVGALSKAYQKHPDFTNTYRYMYSADKNNLSSLYLPPL